MTSAATTRVLIVDKTRGSTKAPAVAGATILESSREALWIARTTDPHVVFLCGVWGDIGARIVREFAEHAPHTVIIVLAEKYRPGDAYLCRVAGAQLYALAGRINVPLLIRSARRRSLELRRECPARRRASLH